MMSPFWSGNGYGFRGTNVFIGSIPNECEFRMDFNESFLIEL